MHFSASFVQITNNLEIFLISTLPCEMVVHRTKYIYAVDMMQLASKMNVKGHKQEFPHMQTQLNT